MIFFDTETCGLCGPCVLIQWAEDDGPVNLHSVWTTPIHETITLIEKICTHPGGIVGFNLSFDWFQICKLYTMLTLYPDWDVEPQDVIMELALLEPKARDGPCLKPVSAMDLMLHARKGPYQSTMDRGDIRLKRIPTTLAWQLAAELEKRISLSDVLFARRKTKGEKWKIYDLEDADGEIDPSFKDIVLKFAPSSALKALAIDALKIPPENLLKYGDIELEGYAYPEEIGYAPFALALASPIEPSTGLPSDWKGTWPVKIKLHISHWGFYERARRYAEDDVIYTRGLYKHFGFPPLGDDDSTLACMVGAVRWKGFACDVEGLKNLRDKTLSAKTKIVGGQLVDGKIVGGKEFKIPTAPGPARWYVQEDMTDTEKLTTEGRAIAGSTKKVLLQTITKWTRDCPICNGTGVVPEVEGGVNTDHLSLGVCGSSSDLPDDKGAMNVLGSSGLVDLAGNLPSARDLRIQASEIINGPVQVHVDSVSSILDHHDSSGSTPIESGHDSVQLSTSIESLPLDHLLTSIVDDSGLFDLDGELPTVPVLCSPNPTGAICKHCKDGAVIHPSAVRAQEVLNARQSQYEADLYDKFIVAGRFHASFKVIGTLSSRMSGGDGLNAQGVKKTKEVRSKFSLAFPGYTLCGGDFAGFEVTLAEACYNDPDLRKALLTCERCEGAMRFVKDPIKVSDFLDDEDHLAEYVNYCLAEEAKKVKKNPAYIPRTADTFKEDLLENDIICMTCGSNKGKKIHALFGMNVYPGMTYEEIKATEGTSDDRYTRCKQAVFAMLYGGEGYTLMDRLGVAIEVAEAAYVMFCKQFKRVGIERKKISDRFSSIRQPGGIGSKVEYTKPDDYVESMFGFRRYFTLENMICKALFDLANKPPSSWKTIKVPVQRRDRVQTAMGAVQSALYGAAFGIQGGIIRAAANHVIQSAGAQVTKMVQRHIWDIQPSGVAKWIVQPMNIHDEIMCPTLPGYEAMVKKVVGDAVESIRDKVPLIKMDWVIGLKSWAEKG